MILVYLPYIFNDFVDPKWLGLMVANIDLFSHFGLLSTKISAEATYYPFLKWLGFCKTILSALYFIVFSEFLFSLFSYWEFVSESFVPPRIDVAIVLPDPCLSTPRLSTNSGCRISERHCSSSTYCFYPRTTSFN